jgi:phosphonate transport system ATP-binding protein
LWLIDEPLAALDPQRALQAIAALVAGARERGITLVTSLHQVDAALAHFPRIVGLRDGVVAFDLPTAQVTPEHLTRLYAQRDNAAPQPLPDAAAADAMPAAVAVVCR